MERLFFRASLLVVCLGLAVFAAPAKAQTYDPGFQLTAGANDWWFEVRADADSVVLQLEGGATHRLSATTWGTFTRGGHLPAGTRIRLTGRKGGASAQTGFFAYRQEAPRLASGDATPPADNTDVPSTGVPSTGGTADGPATGDAGGAAYDPGLRIRESSNDWWLEVYATADTLDLQLEGGATHRLTATAWGTFTRGGHLPTGTRVRFLARRGAASAQTEWFAYRQGTPTLAGGTSGGDTGGTVDTPTTGGSGGGTVDPPTSGAFAATFSGVRGNSWWIEVRVASAETVGTVHVRPRGGDWAQMTLQSWGPWTTSFYVPTGTILEFRARSASGTYAYSGGYRWPDGAQVDAGTGSAEPPATGGAEPPATGGDDGPTVSYPATRTHSPITRAVVDGMRAIAANHAGRDARVFAKVGDSISTGWPFLACLASDPVLLDGRTSLAPTVEWFRAGRIAGTTPWERASTATNSGWTSYATINGNPSVLDQEIAAANPRFAVVMLGTNDAGYRTPDAFEQSMLQIVDRLTDEGVIPILSTIPPIDSTNATATARVPLYNTVLRDIAERRRIPLVDLHRELMRLPDHGLRSDGVHLSTDWNHYIPGSCDFTTRGLAYGTNVRNLLTLEALHRARTAYQTNTPLD